MHLTDEEKRMHNGEYGLGVQRALDLTVKLGQAFDAEHLVPITYGHVTYDNTPEEFWNLMTEEVTHTPHRVTCHPSFQPEVWPNWELEFAAQWKEEHQRKLRKYKELGWLRTETCAEYLLGIFPNQGDIVTMCGSCMQVANNSLFGARVDRMGALISLATAVCGRTPMMGLLIPENRYAKHLVVLEDIDVSHWSLAHYHCLGYLIGDLIPGFQPIAVQDLPPNLSFDNTRALIISMPTSGAITLAHIVGTTPEAPTVEDALGNCQPEHTVKISSHELTQTWERLNVWSDPHIEHVALGCPHATIDEIGRIAALVQGKRLQASLLIGSSVPVQALARQQGYAQIIEQAGGVFLSACPSIFNPFTRYDIAGSQQAKSAATNSARAAHYLASVCGINVFFGTEQECIQAAISGKWQGEIPSWK